MFRRERVGISHIDYLQIAQYMADITNDMDATLPLFLLRDGAAKFSKKNISEKFLQKINDRRCGYRGCLNPVIDVSFIKKMGNEYGGRQFPEKKEIKEYRAFQDIHADFFRKIMDLMGGYLIHYGISARFLIWLLRDIACRLAILNPEEGNNTRYSPGVVLIEGFPKTKMKALDVLVCMLSNIQFIVCLKEA